MTQPLIMVVDDEQDLREAVHDYLLRHDLQSVLAENAAVARRLVVERRIDLAIVDVSMPGEDGFSLARHLRAHHPMGIVFLTARSDVVERVAGLELGADDYIAKPFDPRELVARVKSCLRRVASPAMARGGQGRVRIGTCILDLDAHRLYGEDGRELALTSMEYDLLRLFAENPNRVLSRDQILNATQHRDWDPFDRSVDIRIARLRRKIEPDAAKPQVIRTIRGGGYLFAPRYDG